VNLAPAGLKSEGHRLYAGCGDRRSIELLEVQLEGKKRMPTNAFLNGFTCASDEVLA